MEPIRKLEACEIEYDGKGVDDWVTLTILAKCDFNCKGKHFLVRQNDCLS